MEKRILLVEDDAWVRESLSEALSLEGYLVVCATNGRQGLQILEQGLRPHLVLMDLMMPTMSGWQLLEAIRAVKKFEDIPVVVLSTQGAERMEGVREILPKPFELARLLETVARHLR